jgi:spore coat protein A
MSRSLVSNVGLAVLGSISLLALLGFRFAHNTPSIAETLQAATFTRFVDPLPTLTHIDGTQTPEFSISISQITAQLHRDLPSSQIWGYNGSSPGPVIDVEAGHPIRVHWQNNLPTTHVLAAPTGFEADVTSLPDVRTVTHLHGAAIEEPSITDKLHNNDGWPDAWITPGQEQISDYPNVQDARILWYHDHALGSTGRNVAAGLVGMYLIHDDYERSLNLPSGNYELPLVIQARGISGDGSIFYTQTISNEFYGNAVSVNGKLWPYLNVEPRKYRFRVLNTSNARTYAMKLTDQADQSPGPAFYQIGSDGGLSVPISSSIFQNTQATATCSRTTTWIRAITKLRFLKSCSSMSERLSLKSIQVRCR